MYDVMAVGNALVDHEFLLTEAQLKNKSLTKGSMTLASLQEQSRLLKEFQVQGLKPSKRTGGGSAANAMFAFASLGGKPFYSCRVGDDQPGEFYLKDLNNAGVDTFPKSIFKGGVTGSCVVAITPDGERTMQTYLGTSSSIDENNISFDVLTKSDWLYLEGYMAMSDSLRPAIKKLRHQSGVNNVKIAVSFADPSVINFAKEGLLEILGTGVDTIFCNYDEASLFTGKKQIEATARALMDYCQLAVVTNGPEDTVICERKRDKNLSITKVATPTVAKVTDTNGAGDNYSGAFLYGLSQQYTIPECAKLAGEIASQVVKQFGPRLTPLQYRDIAKRVLRA